MDDVLWMSLRDEIALNEADERTCMVCWYILRLILETCVRRVFYNLQCQGIGAALVERRRQLMTPWQMVEAKTH